MIPSQGTKILHVMQPKKEKETALLGPGPLWQGDLSGILPHGHGHCSNKPSVILQPWSHLTSLNIDTVDWSLLLRHNLVLASVSQYFPGFPQMLLDVLSDSFLQVHLHPRGLYA